MSSESFQKRARERQRQERAAERRERRAARSEADANAPPVDTDALMEQFRVLSERHACGAVDSATYEEGRAAIFAELGLGVPSAD
jgi:hypothetical protein